MTTEKAPSKEASLEGQAILAYPDADIRCRRIWQGGMWAAVGPLGHLQPAGSTIALCGRETGCGNYATEDALRLCRICVEKAVRPTQRKSAIRAERDALLARNVALVTALREIHDWCYGEYREGEKGYQPAIVARAALAADAKAGEDADA